MTKIGSIGKTLFKNLIRAYLKWFSLTLLLPMDYKSENLMSAVCIRFIGISMVSLFYFSITIIFAFHSLLETNHYLEFHRKVQRILGKLLVNRIIELVTLSHPLRWIIITLKSILSCIFPNKWNQFPHKCFFVIFFLFRNRPKKNPEAKNTLYILRIYKQFWLFSIFCTNIGKRILLNIITNM